MQSGTGAAVSAVFTDKASADRCLHELKLEGFHSPWMGVTKPAHSVPPEVNEVVDSSDGVLGAIGRFFSGTSSLRHSLTDHGVTESDAKAIDETMPAEGAIVVVSGDDRADVAASILTRAGAQVRGATTGYGQPRFNDPPASKTDADTVAGQADELDRGTGAGASGGGLGASTGFMSDRGARHDLSSDTVRSVRESTLPHAESDDAPADTQTDQASALPIFYERSSRDGH